MMTGEWEVVGVGGEWVGVRCWGESVWLWAQCGGGRRVGGGEV